ncbi:PaaI family thioesterase [Thermodesulfobacteriota bacterium]
MGSPNPEHTEAIINTINSGPYFKLLSMMIRDIGDGYSLFEIDIADKHLHLFNGVHGGVFSSIIDSAAGWAIYYGIKVENAGLTTVDLKLNFLAPAASGKIIARGHQIKTGKVLGYADCQVTKESGRLLAHGTVTMKILPRDTPLFGSFLPSLSISKDYGYPVTRPYHST